MTTQEVLYRRWRPRRFEDVVGQSPVTTTLRNAIRHGTPSHAYLFCGPRGTGKTTTARIMAKAVNCVAPVDGEPCDACDSCVAHDQGRALDLVELDAASNRGIDEIRDLREGTGYAPVGGRYKVYLIDEVHMLTDAAFNALLKTLEEPPPHVIFVLATTEPHRIPATILSRCQRFDLRRIAVTDVVARLATIGASEGFEVATGGYELIARQATGSLRDAVNLLDQLVAFHGTSLSLEDVRTGLGLVVDDRAADLAHAAVRHDLRAGLTLLAGARDDGVEIRAFLRQVITVLRSVLLLHAGATERLGLSDTEVDALRRIAGDGGVPQVVAALDALSAVDFRGDAYDSLPAEVAFATLCTAPNAAPVATPAAPSLASGAATPSVTSAPATRPAASRPAPGTSRPPARPAATRDAAPGARPAAAAAPAGGGAARPRPTAAPASQPAPSATAPTTVPPGGGEVTRELEVLRTHWASIRATARQAAFQAGALLQNAFPRAAEGDRVEIGFQFPAHLEKARNADGGKVAAAITQAVSSALARAVTVDLVLWEALAEAAPRPATAPTATDGGHLAQEALQLGAEPLDDGR